MILEISSNDRDALTHAITTELKRLIGEDKENSALFSHLWDLRDQLRELE